MNSKIFPVIKDANSCYCIADGLSSNFVIQIGNAGEGDWLGLVNAMQIMFEAHFCMCVITQLYVGWRAASAS